MNVELIREPLKNFRPLALVASSGNTEPPPHPDFLFVTPRTGVVAGRKGNVAVLDPPRGVGLKELPARKNGRARRR
jgi:hypothetical protein